MRVRDIQHLMDMWLVDSEINEFELDTSSIEAAKLHAKYLNIMSTHNLIVKKTIVEYQELKHVRWQYYRGDLNNPQDLKEHGLQPMDRTVLKGDIQSWLEQDKEMNKLLLKKAHHEEIVDSCKEIIKQINNRNWSIRNAIEWKKFTSGI